MRIEAIADRIREAFQTPGPDRLWEARTRANLITAYHRIMLPMHASDLGTRRVYREAEEKDHRELMLGLGQALQSGQFIDTDQLAKEVCRKVFSRYFLSQ